MSFADEVKGYMKLYGLRMEDAIKILMYQLSNGVINRTPVDTGRARGNWVAGINTYPSKVFKNKSGSVALSRAQRVIDKIENGDIFYLTNNLPYIRHLEYGLYPKNVKRGTRIKGKRRNSQTKYEIRTKNGYSLQAPTGMVRIEVRNFRRHLRKAIRKAQARIK